MSDHVTAIRACEHLLIALRRGQHGNAEPGEVARWKAALDGAMATHTRETNND